MANLTLSVVTSPNTLMLSGVKSLGAPADLVATATPASGSPIVLGTLHAQPDVPYSMSATVAPGNYTVQVVASATLSSDTTAPYTVPPATLTATGNNPFGVPANVVVTAIPATGGSPIPIATLTNQPDGPYSVAANVPPGAYTVDTEMCATLSTDTPSSATVFPATLTASGENTLGVPANVVVTATPAGGGIPITIGTLTDQPVGPFSMTVAVPAGDYTVDTEITATLLSTATSSTTVPMTRLTAIGQNTLGVPADIVVTATPTAGGSPITIGMLTSQPVGLFTVTADAPPGDYQIDTEMRGTISSSAQVSSYVQPMTLTVTGVKSLGIPADLVAVATPTGSGCPIPLGTLYNQPDGPYTFVATVPSGDYTVEVSSSTTLYASASSAFTVPAPAFLAATIVYNGKTYTYDETLGTDLGDYVDPQGRFVQGCVRATNAGLPAVVVLFRRDKPPSPSQGSADRSEVVFELGDMFTTATPFNMTGYTATVTKGNTILAVLSVPKHFWHSRWRWQSAPRPLTARVADLIASGLLPHYDKAVAGTFTPASTPRNYLCPMDLAGLTPYMPQTGERDEIGLVTEAQAEYICTGSAVSLASVLAQLEASGTLPWHFRDERTGAPLDVNAYPKPTTYSPNGAVPYIAQANTGITLDPAHEPSLAYLPFLLTGDPYALEELQYAVTYNIVMRPFASRGSWNLGNAVRAVAWATRTQAHAATITPDAVPGWLKPRGYFQTLLNSERDWMLATFVNTTAQPYSTLQVMEQASGATNQGVWMEDFAAAVLAWIVLMGHTDWRPILDWKMKCTIARTNGTSGWIRAVPTVYSLALRAKPTDPYAATWADLWAVNVSTQPATMTYSDPNAMPLTADLTYPSYMLGALAIASTVGVAEARACYDWLRGQITSHESRNIYIRNKWSITV